MPPDSLPRILCRPRFNQGPPPRKLVIFPLKFLDLICLKCSTFVLLAAEAFTLWPTTPPPLSFNQLFPQKDLQLCTKKPGLPPVLPLEDLLLQPPVRRPRDGKRCGQDVANRPDVTGYGSRMDQWTLAEVGVNDNQRSPSRRSDYSTWPHALTHTHPPHPLSWAGCAVLNRLNNT